MIDYDNEIYTYIHNAIKAKFPDCYITGNSENLPPKFPAVAISVMSNVVYNKTRDTGSNENHVAVAIQTDVFSNKKDTPISECKAIMAVADNAYLELGFSRNFYEKIPNSDTHITRFTARHRAVIGKNGTIFRR